MISFSTARKIDRKLGQPLCALASFFLRRQRQASVPEKVKRVLIIKMWGLGSIILGSTVLRSLRHNCPQAKITLLTLEQNRGLYDGNPWIESILYFRMSGLVQVFKSTFNILRVIRSKRFDYIFDFEFGSRFTALLTIFGKARYTVGYAPAGSGKNVFDLTVPFHESLFLPKLFLRAIDRLHWEVISETPIKPAITESDRNEVAHFLRTFNGQPLIVINPNSSALARERQWPLIFIIELARKLLHSYPQHQLVLIGGSEDRGRCEYLARLIRNHGRVTIAAGKLTIRESYVLLQKSSLLISNDSGPMHLGLLAGTDTIGLFGPETPLIYGWPTPQHTTLSSAEICSPCISVYNDKVVDCPFTVRCMTNISVEQVFSAARFRLGLPEKQKAQRKVARE